MSADSLGLVCGPPKAWFNSGSSDSYSQLTISSEAMLAVKSCSVPRTSPVKPARDSRTCARSLRVTVRPAGVSSEIGTPHSRPHSRSCGVTGVRM